MPNTKPGTVRISDMNAATLAAFSKHIALLHSLVPALAPKAAVAFGLSAFTRAQCVLSALTTDGEEQVWFARLTALEEEWWQWCTGERGEFPIVSPEAQRVVDALEERDLPDPLRLTVHATCLALFSAFEAGDHAHGRYTAMQNFTVIELLEEELPQEAVDALSFRELERQEHELLLLVDGVDSQTRAKLSAGAVADNLVGEHLALMPIHPLR